MKGQPLAYNRDNQEDKEPLFDTVDTLKDTLLIFAEMAEGITVQPEAMEAAARRGYATATDLADWLVRVLGLPFRDAHHVTGRLVAEASARGVGLEDLPLVAMQEIEPRITGSVLDVLGVDASVRSRTSFGGTAPGNVSREAAGWLRRLDGAVSLGG